jgi:hypothetical protein
MHVAQSGFSIQDLNINVDTKRDVLLSVWAARRFSRLSGSW